MQAKTSVARQLRVVPVDELAIVAQDEAAGEAFNVAVR
jgi:hypothetical protein